MPRGQHQLDHQHYSNCKKVLQQLEEGPTPITASTAQTPSLFSNAAPQYGTVPCCTADNKKLSRITGTLLPRLEDIYRTHCTTAHLPNTASHSPRLLGGATGRCHKAKEQLLPQSCCTAESDQIQPDLFAHPL